LLVEVEIVKVMLTRTVVEVGEMGMPVEIGRIVNGTEGLVEVLLKVKSEELVEVGMVKVLTVRRGSSRSIDSRSRKGRQDCNNNVVSNSKDSVSSSGS
jgi:hypothetical protein